MGDVMTRRAAMVAAAGLAISGVPGCGAVAQVLKVPFVKVLGAVLRNAGTVGKWVLVITGVTHGGQTEAKEFSVDSDDVKSVTVELKDGTKQTITPTKAGQ